MNHSSVLIVSDDAEFGRTVVARWQAERSVPEITLATSDVCDAKSPDTGDLIIVGPVRNGARADLLSRLASSSGATVICIAEDEKHVAALRSEYPPALVVRRQDGWTEALLLVSTESLRRTEALARAQRAERLALSCQRDATLGRYMLDMRPSVNNALTSVLGNADLLLLMQAEIPTESRQQIQTIHAMALRLNEIVQRFSSLASEMRATEHEPAAEAQAESLALLR